MGGAIEKCYGTHTVCLLCVVIVVADLVSFCLLIEKKIRGEEYKQSNKEQFNIATQNSSSK